MLTNHGGEYPYRMTELYEKLELAQSKYARWIKSNLLESFRPGLDYQVLDIMSRTPKGGHSKQDYALTQKYT
ncbi:antA/AntB antirepressor family protein [Emticicia sp. BO119]|uniref:antA/AntB antirepressor family protein n=1 Tax=Emticicia sp. BO119 TaxID=2757768 RepID=UPI0015F036C9|nr:antA/AntB antirepressor family protein [Emticicia sp. BO119]MBA4852024.1 antA/AntB antirepressor family protein [Emticicia sp. BO119]